MPLRRRGLQATLFQEGNWVPWRDTRRRVIFPGADGAAPSIIPCSTSTLSESAAIDYALGGAGRVASEIVEMCEGVATVVTLNESCPNCRRAMTALNIRSV